MILVFDEGSQLSQYLPIKTRQNLTKPGQANGFVFVFVSLLGKYGLDPEVIGSTCILMVVF